MSSNKVKAFEELLAQQEYEARLCCIVLVASSARLCKTASDMMFVKP